MNLLRASRLSASICLLLNLATCSVLAQVANQPNAASNQTVSPRAWLNQVRIAAYPLSSTNAEAIVRSAKDSHVFGIEVDNDIPGRYESLLHPEVKLAAIRKLATLAHANGQKAFVYIAGFECITSKASGEKTLAREHPEWLQRKIGGQPAIFDTKAAFWIAPGEEDTWVSPYAADWRKLYMQRIRQIAATGIDGIYVDIPYWMTHFTGWEDSWASFDDATVAAFQKQTGLNAKHDIKLGDFQDPAFRQWVDFRIATITTFMADIRANAIAVNPAISVIPEIYPGIEKESVRVGADVYQLYPVVDAIAHEYEFGDAEDHTAASRTPFDWMMYQVGIRSFRAFAGDKPTWILNYSWDGAPHVPPAEAMQTLFMSEVMAVANVWDARGHVMSGSNDLAERRTVYKWLADHQQILTSPREPLADIGVYFSDTSRNIDAQAFLQSYQGTILMLMQAHRQFQIVTPRTLNTFHGGTLILPAVSIVSDAEARTLSNYAEKGRVVIAGKSNDKLNALGNAVRLAQDPTANYLARATSDFANTTPDAASPLLRSLASEPPSKQITVTASKNLVAHASTIGGVPTIFLANFDGLKAGETLVPAAQHQVAIEVPAAFGTSMHLLPFLGSETIITGTKKAERTTFAIPVIERGAIVWIQ